MATLREARRPLFWLGLLVVLVAAVNVPVAFLFVRPLTGPRPPGRINIIGPAAAAYDWPAATPHEQRWPAITQWQDSGRFGERWLEAWSATPDRQTTHQMAVYRYGWPIAPLERRMLWWPWTDPAWAIGVRPDQDLKLRWEGLLLGPLLVGGALWVLVILLPMAWRWARRAARRRRGSCPSCGYNLEGTGGLGSGCPECGWGRAEVKPALATE